MGALLTCFSDARESGPGPKPSRRSHESDRPSVSAAAAMGALGLGSSVQRSKGRAGSKDVLTDDQALAAAALLMQRNGVCAGAVPIPFDRSRSVRQPGGQKKLQGLPRSSSTRPPSLADPIVPPQQLLNQVRPRRLIFRRLIAYMRMKKVSNLR